MTITDDMLREAAAEAGYALARSLPAPEACEHDFSPRFLRKMRPLLRTGRPARHPVLRRTVAAVLALVVSASVWLSVDMDARASLLSWVRTQRENGIFSYRFAGSDQQEAVPLYLPTWVPEGFVEAERDIKNWNAWVLYTGPDNNYFSVDSTWIQDGTGMAVIPYPGQELTPVPVSVNGLPGDLYLSADPETGRGSNNLVWFDDQAHIYFGIDSSLDGETMLRIAQSVSPADSTK